MIPFLWVGPIQTIVSLCLLWPTLGPACLGSLLVLSLLVPIQFYLSEKFARFRRRIAACTDERVRLLNETITSLRLIKLYAWEQSFRETLAESRRKETDLINRVAIIKGIGAGLMYISSKLVLFVTILFHCLVFGSPLDGKTLFMSMAMLNNVQFIMTQLMPRVVSLGVESLVSLRRIRDFLLEKEFPTSGNLEIGPVHKESLRLQNRKHNGGISESAGAPVDRTKLLLLSPPPRPLADFAADKQVAFIENRDVCARWPSAETQTLNRISFTSESPALIMICGQVASGKSSLLMSLLSELPITTGHAKIHGSLSYASQTPWIFSGTVRDNIVFGHGYQEGRYKRVVDVCALQHDFDLLEHGDRTYIQEDSLSGGQKARVNLARCLYRDSDIYLLDDPFSAIDGRVADHIFEEAIVKFLSGKLVLMTTHKVGLLCQSTRVLLLDGGKQLAYCSFPELGATLRDLNSDQRKRLSFLLDIIDDNRDQQAQMPSVGQIDSNIYKAAANVLDFSGHSMAAGQHATGGEATSSVADRARIFSASECVSCTSEQNKILDGQKQTPTNAPSKPMRGGDKFCICSKTRGPTISVGNFSSGSSSGKPFQEDSSERSEAINEEESNEPQANLITVDSNSVTSGRRPLVAQQTIDKNPITGGGGGEPATRANFVEGSGSKEQLSLRVISSGGGSARSSSFCEVASNASDGYSDHPGGGYNQVSSLTSCDGHYRPTLQASSQTRPVVKLGEEAHSNNSASKLEGNIDSTNGIHNKLVDNAQALEANNKRAPINGQQSAEGDSGRCRSAMAANGPVDEDMPTNKVAGARIWYKYYTQTSTIRLGLLVLTFLITQALFSTIDIYLTVWSLVEQNNALLIEITGSNQQQLETFKHEPYINQLRPLAVASIMTDHRVITYDTLAGDSPLLMSLSLPEYNRTTTAPDDSRDGTQTGGGGGSILPLSSQSSPKASSTVLLVSPRSAQIPLLVVDLLYSTLGGGGSGIGEPSADDGDGSSAANGDTLERYDNGSLTKGSSLDNNNYDIVRTGTDDKQHTDHAQQNQMTPPSQIDNIVVSPITSPSTDGGDDDDGRNDEPEMVAAVIIDRNIHEESDEALNIKLIYRPLYLLVNNFTSIQHATTYAILLMVLFSFSAAANVLSLTSSNKSAIALYKKLIDSALFARISFFDRNPVGRFLNRATRDIGIIDEAIPYNANQAYDALLQTAATFIVVAAVDITLALPSLIILSLFLIFHSIHVESTKDIQRLEGISRSPIITHVSTTLNGLQTIRATKAERRFEQSFMRHQDIHTSRFLLYLGCNRCMAVVLDWLNASYTGTIVLWVLLSGLSGPSAGLIITSAMLLSGLTQHGMMKLTETESLMTSVERVIEYCNLPQEEATCCESKGNNNRPTTKMSMVEAHSAGECGSWQPSKGCIEYKHVDLYYNRLDKPVLKNISFKLESGEKVGIIGRTGAGKSSIITTLFRLYDYDGTILIDGVDIETVSLANLRAAIGIIPQTPILFSTTIRKNLDPFQRYDDFLLWAALEKAHLRTTVSALPGKLDYNIGNGGLSSGQKQLMCLARVLLRQNSIIVLDEATANVDPNTDAIIQTTIRSEFKHCTVITIAHRLETILDCDRIMVLDAGRIVDFDTPERSAAKSNDHFARLLTKSTEY